MKAKLFFTGAFSDVSITEQMNTFLKRILILRLRQLNTK